MYEVKVDLVRVSLDPGFGLCEGSNFRRSVRFELVLVWFVDERDAVGWQYGDLARPSLLARQLADGEESHQRARDDDSLHGATLLGCLEDIECPADGRTHKVGVLLVQGDLLAAAGDLEGRGDVDDVRYVSGGIVVGVSGGKIGD